MTECEKLLECGFLPASFFEEEVNSGFLVTTERKKIWAVELDLLMRFIAVCEKYNLRYFLIGGSLLGAVRHKGIIPWDDDIDVGMPRRDYDRFLELGNEFEYPYFLQTPHTDPGYAYSFAKLRNSETTCVVPMFKYQSFNQGIFLDIFPYENWDQEKGKYLYDRIHKLAYDNSTYMRLTNPDLDARNKERVRNWPGRDYVDVYDEIQQLARSFENEDTRKIAKVVFSFSLPQEVHDMEAYQETITAVFNGFSVKIPKGYDHILNTYYGPNYMDFPPLEKRNGGHDTAIFDPDRGFKQFLDQSLSY